MKSEVKGVHFIKSRNRWEARVTTGRRELLGRFRTQEGAETVMEAYNISKELPYVAAIDEFFWTGEPLPSLKKRGLAARLSEWWNKEKTRLHK